MNKSFWPRFWFALRETILYIACLHLIILIIYAFVTHQFVYLSIANILDLQLLDKNFPYTAATAALTLLPVLALLYWHWRRYKS